MKRLSLDEIVKLVLYYQNHNADETLQKFGVSRFSLFRYVRKYDGTEESLKDGRKNRQKRISFTEEEEKSFRDSLMVYNSPDRERYVIVPSYKAVYCDDTEYKGKRTYWEASHWARKILSNCIPLFVRRKRKRGTYANRAERRKYHAAKKPGTLQIDMMYIPLECYFEAMSSPEKLEKLHRQLIKEARKETEAVVKAYKVEAQKNPQVRTFLLCSCKEAWKEFQQICDDVMKCSAEELLPRRFYQYTAVDEYSGWAYRQIYITHSEASAMLFMADASAPTQNTTTENTKRKRRSTASFLFPDIEKLQKALYNEEKRTNTQRRRDRRANDEKARDFGIHHETAPIPIGCAAGHHG